MTILALISTVALPDASSQSLYAGWVDQSDELPGMISDGEMLLIAGGAVVVIGGLITYLIIKKKQDKKLEAAMPEFMNFSESLAFCTNKGSVSSFESFCNEVNKTTRMQVFYFIPDLIKFPSVNPSNSGMWFHWVRVN